MLLRMTIFGLLCLTASPAWATALMGPQCTVSAAIIEKLVEERKGMQANGEPIVYQFSFVRLQVISVEPASLDADCGFLNPGDVFATDGGSEPELLAEGQMIEVGAELVSAMSTSGAVSFIQWSPVRVVSPEGVVLPRGFILQSAYGEDPDAQEDTP